MAECDFVSAGRFRLAVAFCMSLFTMGLCGCQTAQYYRQAIAGESQILRRRIPIAKLMADPATPAALKQKFELVKGLREFAQVELKLPINKHYITYVDLHRRFAIWNVTAAPEFSLQPRKWWYPFVGSLKYRGYFFEKDAREYASRLADQRQEAYVEGIEAYSTLGWFADPLLNTFIAHAEADLAETIFHELTHQRLFLSGDTDFNEAFATVVAEEGVRRWFAAAQDQAGYQKYQVELGRSEQFVALVMKARRQLQEIYGETDEHHAKRSPSGAAQAQMRRAKSDVTAQLRAGYQDLKVSWGGYAGYDAWFAQSLNNAQLNTIAVYYELVPGFQALLREKAGDLEGFYKTVQEMRHLKKDARHQRLRELGKSSQASFLPFPVSWQRALTRPSVALSYQVGEAWAGCSSGVSS
jgi:predicted aminopeptidase